MSTFPETPGQLPLSVHCQSATPSQGSSARGLETPHSAWCSGQCAISSRSAFER